MKAFNEWWYNNGNFVSDKSRGDSFVASEIVWKAALEWIYIEMTGMDLSETRNLIDEELDDD